MSGGRCKLGSCCFRNEGGFEIKLQAARHLGKVTIESSGIAHALRHELTEIEARKLASLLAFLLHDEPSTAAAA